MAADVYESNKARFIPCFVADIQHCSGITELL